MRKVFEIGGVVAAAVLIAFGIVAIVMGFNGRSTVTDSLKQGADRRLARHDAGGHQGRGEGCRPGGQQDQLPTLAVAGKAINSGPRAHAFASYMRIHALEATQGLPYSQMGRYQALPERSEAVHGRDRRDQTTRSTRSSTQDEAAGGQRPTQRLGDRDCALTALNASYMADRIALFGVVVGIACC